MLDLHQSAASAALGAMTKDAYSIAEAKVELFTAGGFDPVDFGDWDAMFNDRLHMYVALSNRPTKSAQMAMSEAAAAEAKTKNAALAAGTKTATVTSTK